MSSKIRRIPKILRDIEGDGSFGSRRCTGRVRHQSVSHGSVKEKGCIREVGTLGRV